MAKDDSEAGGEIVALGGNAQTALKNIVERVERLNEEKKAITEDTREVYAEAKAFGLNPKIIRKLVSRRAQEKAKREEEDAVLELYEGAVGL